MNKVMSDFIDKKNSTKQITLPVEFRHYFWDCDFEKLTWKKYSFFIAERLLNYGNIEAIKWLLYISSVRFIKKVVKESKNLDKKTRNFWEIIHGK